MFPTQDLILILDAYAVLNSQERVNSENPPPLIDGWYLTQIEREREMGEQGYTACASSAPMVNWAYRDFLL